MAVPPTEFQRLSPDKLTVTFSRSRISRWVLLAIAAHLLLVAATSVTYVRDRWVDPEGAARRKAERLAAAKAGARAPATEAAPGTAADGAKGTPQPTTQTAPGTGTAAARTPQEQEMEKRKGAPVIQQITEKAKKDDIPREPDDIGISIDETNR